MGEADNRGFQEKIVQYFDTKRQLFEFYTTTLVELV